VRVADEEEEEEEEEEEKRTRGTAGWRLARYRERARRLDERDEVAD